MGTAFVFSSALASFPISVINLDRDEARLASVMRELKAQGVLKSAFERQSAVLGSSLSDEELCANTTFLARWLATRGMIGCYLSHRNFWKSVQQRDAEWAVVLEDDVQLEDAFCARVSQAVEELQACAETRDKWDVLMLGALGCVNPERKYGGGRISAFIAGGGRKPRQVTEHVHVPHRPFGTHAYALSKRGAAKLLQRAPIASSHIDAVAWGLRDLNLYCVHPMLAHQAFDDSSIGGTQGGPESRLPNVCIDEYTKITLRWAFNEPVLYVVPLKLKLTIGRSLLLLVLGYAAALLSGSRALLAIHSGVFVATAMLIRHMAQPVC